MEERLVKFARVVDAGSFTKAAALLRISQPALTTAVKKLERELHAELLIRSSSGLTLTAAGTIAYETAKQITTHTENARTQIREILHEKVTVSLGMIDSLAQLLFVQGSYLQELEKKTRLSLTIDNSARLVRLIERDDLDVAMITRPADIPGPLVAQELAFEPLVITTHRDLHKNVTAQLDTKQLDHFLAYNQASCTFSIIEAHFAAQGITLQPTFYSTSPEIMLQLVLHKRGTAVLPYQLVRPYIEQQVLQAVRIHGSCVIPRAIVAIQRRGKILPMHAEQALARARHELETLFAEASSL